MREADMVVASRWTRVLTRVSLAWLVLVIAAGPLALMNQTVAAGVALILGGLGLMFSVWSLMMLSAFREYRRGHWPQLDASRGPIELGNPALYRYFGRVFRGMFRW